MAKRSRSARVSSETARTRKPTANELDAARDRTLRDVIDRRLDVLFVGINPSLYSAAVGHHFARPGNRFWPALHRSGFTPQQLDPVQDERLLEWRLGVTNMVARATARADELTKEELVAGARVLKRKLTRYRPRFVAVVGITAYRTAFGQPEASVGLQPDHTFADARFWVLPNPSGLNAHYQLPDLARVFGQLREAVEQESTGRE